MTWSTPYTGIRRPARPKAAVTSRQLQILALAASGYTAAQIATRLGIQASTVHERLHRTYRKLGARNCAHAVAIALVTGLLDADDIEMPGSATATSARQKPASSPQTPVGVVGGAREGRGAQKPAQRRTGPREEVAA